MPRARAGETLTLYLGSGRIPAKVFTDAVTTFYDLVQEVTKETTGEAGDIEWIVKVKAGSANIYYIGQPTSPEVRVTEVTERVLEGTRNLGQRPTRSHRVKRPEGFSDRALQDSKELSEIGKKLEVLQVRRSRKRAKVLPFVATNVSEILQRMPVEVGAVEGRLEMLSMRRGNHFGLWDDLFDKQVRCNIPHDKPELFEEAMRAMGQRVSVFGAVRMSEEGFASSIEVHRIEVFPDKSELPSADDVYGILREGE